MSAGVWIEVPDDTTLADAEGLFCWGTEARNFGKPAVAEDVKKIEVKGSKGRPLKGRLKDFSKPSECL